MSEQAIELKGSLFTLSVLHLVQNDLHELKSSLKAKIEQAPGFFFRAPVVVNIEKLADEVIDFNALRAVIVEMSLVLVGICGGTTAQKQSAKDQGLAVLSHGKASSPAIDKVEAQQSIETVERIVEVEKIVEKIIEKPVFEPAKEVRQNIRSGQQVYAKDTDLIILGSVGHGAEVIADGNIHVYGTLRGKAIAGAKGNKHAKIYCQNIQADLVSICGNYMMSEALQAQLWDKPASIELSEEKLIISELN
ncbi:MAG: septum site-determining protein MinC [Algicola sp.]|nr:septum site-determining protein MinC [Algicola sp.]